MRYLKRRLLSEQTRSVLDGLHEKVHADPDPKGRAERLWNAKTSSNVPQRRQAFEEIRRTLDEMASGLGRCMYCEDSAGTDIDHYWPKSAYPLGAFLWENYLLVCSGCNSGYKKDLFRLDGEQPLLLDPTQDDPTEHMILLLSNGKFDALGMRGDYTIRLLNLNGEEAEPDETMRLRKRELPRGRKATLRKLQSLVLDYQQWKAEGKETEAQETKDAILEHPFSAVLVWLLRVAENPEAAWVLRDGVVAAIQRHRMDTWVDWRP